MSEPDPSPSPLMLLKNADANLELLHLHPERVQPLRIVDMRAYRELLVRIGDRIADKREDIEGGAR